MFEKNLIEDKLRYYFGKYGLEVSDDIINKFSIFADYLISENKKYNLTAICEPEQIIIKHFVDSAVILNYLDLPAGAGVLDIGAGAGFPSVPLAVMRGDLNITCLDSSAKKINFIKSAADKLGLANLEFFCGRAEDLKMREYYDFSVSRAVARLNILCEFAAPVLKIGGVFCAYKAKDAQSEINGAVDALKILGLELVNNMKFELEGEERAFIIIKKISATPGKYPRNFSQISKSPL